MEQEKSENKKSVKSRVSVFLAGVLLTLATVMVGGSNWFLQVSRDVSPYVEQASEYAEKASEVSRGVVSVASKKLGSASAGLSTTIASSSAMIVGPQNNVRLFPATVRANCSARVISTVAQPIMLYFGSSASNAASDATTTVSALIGHVQSASTTVVYDAGIYGCGPVGVYGFNASTTITAAEFQ